MFEYRVITQASPVDRKLADKATDRRSLLAKEQQLWGRKNGLRLYKGFDTGRVKALISRLFVHQQRLSRSLTPRCKVEVEVYSPTGKPAIKVYWS